MRWSVFVLAHYDLSYSCHITLSLKIFAVVVLMPTFSSWSRLKKIQEKKKQLRERTELEIAARLAKLGPIAEPANMLTEENDEDLLFEWSCGPLGRRSPTSPIVLFILCLSGQVLCLLMQVMKVVLFFCVLLVVDDFVLLFQCWKRCCVFPFVSPCRTKVLSHSAVTLKGVG